MICPHLHEGHSDAEQDDAGTRRADSDPPDLMKSPMQLSVCAKASPSCNLAARAGKSYVQAAASSEDKAIQWLLQPLRAKDANELVDLNVATIHRQACGKAMNHSL